MYQQANQAPHVPHGAQPPGPAHYSATPPVMQWHPAVVGGGAVAPAHVPPMQTRDGVAGLAIGLCILTAALAAGIGFTVRETAPVEPAAAAAKGMTATPAPEAATPLAADGHAHKH